MRYRKLKKQFKRIIRLLCSVIAYILCLLWPIHLQAQDPKGIKFIETDNWQRVLQMAKQAHKNILVDVVATWCGPCKKMDAEVYTDAKIKNFVEQNFLPIKLQVDKTKKDAEQVKKWYPDAAKLQTAFNIKAVPTFLFINPNGTLVYRAEGFKNKDAFISVLQNANDPAFDFSKLLNQFNNGKLKVNELLKLSLAAKDYREDCLAIKIAKEYKRTVIDKNDPERILSANAQKFMTSFYQLFSLEDTVIKLMYKNPTLTDSLFKDKGFSKRITDYIIACDVINPIICPNNVYSKRAINWDSLENSIAKRYDGKTAKRLILSSKLSWYNNKKDWPNIVKYNLETIEFNGLDTAGIGKAMLNNMIYNVIFKHSDDMNALNKAIQYMELLLTSRPNFDSWMDTYANLLYKIGRKNEAITQEQKALTIAESKNDKESITTYKDIIYKMKNNQPTWLGAE